MALLMHTVDGSRSTRTALAVSAALVMASNGFSQQPSGATASNEAKTYSRRAESYLVPAVSLVNMAGEQVLLRSVLDDQRPVMVQFVFTTCSTICPVLSNTFSSVQQEFDPNDPVRMVSISIDPEHDTPARLRQYAERLQANPDWVFLTGAHEDISEVQRAFDAYQVNKMNHQPLTFIRPTIGSPWVRLNGLMSAAELVDEFGAAVATARKNLEFGRRLYEQGIGVSGEPVRATVHDDPVRDPAQFTCASCHRRSGFGTAEGGTLAMPIAGSALGKPRDWRGQDLMRNLYREDQPLAFRRRLHEIRGRPAYSDEALVRALRDGVDSAGNTLDPTMPLYDLSEDDAANLITYLRQLSTQTAPGVDDTDIHLATVILDDADPIRRQAMLDTMNAYVERRNLYTRNELVHTGHSPGFKDFFESGYRQWVLHVWDLTGPAETWTEQLEAYYRQTPVFAMVSGLGKAPWAPIHAFCEAHRIPCVFPNTDYPPLGEPGVYPFYFSRGIVLEAEAMAQFLREREGVAPVRIVQLYEDHPQGVFPAHVLETALSSTDNIEIVNRAMKAGSPLTEAALDFSFADDRRTLVVAWLGEIDLDVIAAAAENADVWYISSTLTGSVPRVIPQGLNDKAFYIYPFGLRPEMIPAIQQDRSWFKSRRLEIVDERLQLNTYFAMTITENALMHIIDTFSREYFVEGIEHITEEQLTFGSYARMSLGPDQRLGSKGCYIVRPARQGPVAVSKWIVP